MKHLTDTLREALEAAQNGLKWYRDTYPDADSQADDEMNAEIEEALTALSELEQAAGNQEPVAWMASFTNRYGNPDVYVTTHKHLAVENDENGSPRPLVFGDTAPPAQQQYEAGDMASAHNDGFRAGVASVTVDQEPVAWAVYWGLPPTRQNSVHFDKESAQAVANQIKSATEVRPLYAAPVAQQPQQVKAYRAPTKTEWGAGMVCIDIELDKDTTATVFFDREDTTKVEQRFNVGVKNV